MKTYANASNAKRAAVATLAQTLGMAVAEVKAKFGTKILIEKTAGGFAWVNTTLGLLEKTDGKLHQSAMKGACSLVWDIASSMLTADPSTKRKQILEACQDRGIAYYTARTQYQQYREAVASSSVRP